MKKNLEYSAKSIRFIKYIILIGFIFLSTFHVPANNQDNQKKEKESKAGAFDSGKYRNVFLEFGYQKSDIENKVAKAYYDLFEGPDKIYFEVGDSMAYITDLKNNDARTEGLSYGLMVAVQLNKKDVFDRIWRWTNKYLQHHGGAGDSSYNFNKESAFAKTYYEYDPEYYLGRNIEVLYIILSLSKLCKEVGILYKESFMKILNIFFPKLCSL